MDKNTVRLIDANYLKEAVKAWVGMDAYYSGKSPRSIKTIPISEINALIDDTPTIKVYGEIRKDGVWICESELKQIYHCNNCRSVAYNRHQPFCAWCGAKMQTEEV